MDCWDYAAAVDEAEEGVGRGGEGKRRRVGHTLGGDAPGPTWGPGAESAGVEPGKAAADDKADTLWATHEVSLLAEITNIIHVKDFRPIAVLPVLYKLHSRVLYMLGDSVCRSLEAPQFAFRKFHQAHEHVFILRQLIERAVE